ncbi:DUF6876 family protein [Merismopedia glauca]|uniref:DUF6876 domain-containing protein n=1 Tax=Merismopedia glauca CCAP 1448/3 TaxID=1296344 RepID=A0A2T1BZE7_9CYAN|nr:DUF6876 family protein [Merismopedia glauca]PSB01399.1 hypothetical protein C7B64_18595 [Merismopedia glauca CCAP 1448/3]
MHITQGIKHLASDRHCYWLIDAIRSYQPQLRKKQDLVEFQLWELTVDLDKSTAVLTCKADKNEPPSVEQHIEFTDYPEKTAKFYVCDDVLMLPEEY